MSLACTCAAIVKKAQSFIAHCLLSDRSVRVGQRLQCDRLPRILVTQNGRIDIGNDVLIRQNVELRCHHDSRLIIEDGVKLDSGVRIVACYSGEVRIRKGAEIGFYSVLNGAGGIDIGQETLIAGFVNIQASKHRIAAASRIKSQGSEHLPVSIGSDCWVGAHTTIVGGIQVGDGAIIGANAVVTHSVPSYEIWAGIPARFLKKRA